MNKPYINEVSLDDIIEKGWCKRFPPSQTIEEAKLMGFFLTEEEVITEWERYDQAMAESFIWEGENHL